MLGRGYHTHSHAGLFYPRDLIESAGLTAAAMSFLWTRKADYESTSREVIAKELLDMGRLKGKWPVVVVGWTADVSLPLLTVLGGPL